jgi:hypoxanthine phosphoribosyltransferase
MTSQPPVEPLISAAEIADRVRALGAEITARYAGCPVTLVGVLNGSTFFVADLARAIDLSVRIDFVSLSSYGDATESSGRVQVRVGAKTSLEDRDVIVVEDIVDTGLPRSIAICTLLDKPSRRRVDVPIDYVGFSIPDRFVVGYGLDYAERYRNLPFVGCLDPSDLGE